jgi:hypothetical protein
MIEDKVSAFYSRGVPLVNVWMALSFIAKMKLHQVGDREGGWQWAGGCVAPMSGCAVIGQMQRQRQSSGCVLPRQGAPALEKVAVWHPHAGEDRGERPHTGEGERQVDSAVEQNGCGGPMERTPAPQHFRSKSGTGGQQYASNMSSSYVLLPETVFL